MKNTPRPLGSRDPRDDELILLLGDLATLRQFARDSSPAAVMPRSLRGGNPLAAWQSVGEANDVHPAEVKRMARRLIRNGDDDRTTRDRRAFVEALAAEELPGDPAESYDPAYAQAIRARVNEAPEDVRAVLDVLCGVTVIYTPWEDVAVLVADALAPSELRDAWCRKQVRDVPSPEVWGGAQLEDVVAWWGRSVEQRVA